MNQAMALPHGNGFAGGGAIRGDACCPIICGGCALFPVGDEVAWSAKTSVAPAALCAVLENTKVADGSIDAAWVSKGAERTVPSIKQKVKVSSKVREQVGQLFMFKVYRRAIHSRIELNT